MLDSFWDLRLASDKCIWKVTLVVLNEYAFEVDPTMIQITVDSVYKYYKLHIQPEA